MRNSSSAFKYIWCGVFISGITSHHREKSCWPQRATSLGSAPASGEDERFGQLLERCASSFWLNKQGEGSGELGQLIFTWYHQKITSLDPMRSPWLYRGANSWWRAGGARGFLMFSSCSSCPWCSHTVPVSSLQTPQPALGQGAAHPKQTPPNQTHRPEKHTVVQTGKKNEKEKKKKKLVVCKSYCPGPTMLTW